MLCVTRFTTIFQGQYIDTLLELFNDHTYNAFLPTDEPLIPRKEK